MDIKEIIKEKRKLQSQIYKLVKDFERNTNIIVNGIDVTRISTTTIGSQEQSSSILNSIIMETNIE